MLDDLGSYSLSDFLQFSPETYFRLFELYNRDVWPLQVLTLALALALPWLMRRSAGRTAEAILTLAWAWVGWAFHLERYATINIAAPYFAALFGVEALLLLGISVCAGGLRFAGRVTLVVRIGFGLVLFAVFVNPLVGLMAGRSWAALSIFGLGPDPTAIATIGVLLASSGRMRWLMLIPPAIWCAISVLTAVAMESVEGVGTAVALILVLAVAGAAGVSRLRLRLSRPAA